MVRQPKLKVIPCNRSQSDVDAILECWSQGDCVVPISNKLPQTRITEIEYTYHNQTTPYQNAHFMIFSSGSTGLPKAIFHSKESTQMAAKGSCEVNAVDSKSKMLLSLPLFHVSGLSILCRSLHAKAALHPYDNDQSLIAQLHGLHITHVSLVTTQLKELTQYNKTFPDLVSVLVGGSAIPKTILENAISKGLPIQTTYGLSEMGGQVTTSSLNNTQKIINGSGEVLSLRQVKIDEQGQIWVSGPCLSINADTTDGWYNTGDLGKWVEDQLIVMGRADDMIISGGENIYPIEIEQCIMQVEQVHACKVIGIKNETYGERPIAFIKLSENNDLNTKNKNPNPLPLSLIRKIKHNIKKNHANYMVPDAYFPYPEMTKGIKPSKEELHQVLRQFIPK